MRVALGPMLPVSLGDDDGISSSVTITLSSKDNPAIFGPEVNISLAIPVEQATSFVDAQDALLEAAHGVLARAAAESLEALQAARRQRSWLDQIHERD
jgi:hypothetical protein